MKINTQNYREFESDVVRQMFKITTPHSFILDNTALTAWFAVAVSALNLI